MPKSSYSPSSKEKFKVELNQLNSMMVPSNNAIEFTTDIEKQKAAFPTRYIPEIKLDKDGNLLQASLEICDRHSKTIFMYHQL